MGRVARFGQYLSNDPSATAAAAKRRGPQALRSADAQGPRDEFEKKLTEGLSPFFEIRSITFAAPDVKPRPAARPGWAETTLAYVLVRAKDASVDKIPPVQMELRFIDLSGPVTVPATSAETLLKVAGGKASPRPADKIEVTQTLDTRQFAINGSLSLEVAATASGTVPELDDLLDLAPLAALAKVRQVTVIDPLMVKELNTWGDQVAPRTERRWSVTLDGDAIRAADKATDLPFPTIKAANATTVWRTYQDIDPVDEYHREAGDAALGSAVARLEALSMKFTSHILVGEVASTIANFASTSECSLIVMGVHGRGSVVSLLMGSVSTKVIHHSTVPVLLTK
jgi:nucleotide-binding universal stress UspA family protein